MAKIRQIFISLFFNEISVIMSFGCKFVHMKLLTIFTHFREFVEFVLLKMVIFISVYGIMTACQITKSPDKRRLDIDPIHSLRVENETTSVRGYLLSVSCMLHYVHLTGIGAGKSKITVIIYVTFPTRHLSSLKIKRLMAMGYAPWQSSVSHGC